MKGLLIDVHNRTVTEVEYSDLDSIYTLVKCELITTGGEYRGHTVYVDDEGLLKDPKEFFQWPGYPDWLAGNGLLVGPVDAEGETTDITLDPREMKALINFRHIEGDNV